tara:strand:- start:921 stop:1520 length:600 start_codon:yes stop_codon:yes gene_type:complete
MNKPLLIFVMGPTCAGKSTLLESAQERFGNALGLVEVGKELRAKYPPEYFEGQNNPKHTADEAWEICNTRVWEHFREKKQVILVDGQPRDVPQVHLCNTEFTSSHFVKRYLLIDAPIEARRNRAKAGRSQEDFEKLAEPRLTNDMIQYYTVLVELLKIDRKIKVFDTTNSEVMPEHLIMRNIIGWMEHEVERNKQRLLG